MATEDALPSMTSVPTGMLLSDMEHRLDRRLDKQDIVLDSVVKNLADFATKQDVHEIHEAVDKMGSRVTTLEETSMTTSSVKNHKNHTWHIIAAVAGLIVSAAIAAGTILALVH